DAQHVSKIYEELAPWYSLLTSPEDYAEEARWYADLLRGHAAREVREVLELGCGSGANASHMKAWFQMVVSDLSPAMLRECSRINPDLEQHVGDLRSLRLDRRFDAVFVHDAASYLLRPDEVTAAVETAKVHLRPGGVVLFCPDDLAENFAPGTESGGHDAADGRGLRYLEWSRAGERDEEVVTDYALLLREADGSVRVAYDRHLTGRLSGTVWTSALTEAGFEVRKVPLQHSEVDEGRHHAFVGVLAL
ncbi:MAG: class I SAM-dependent methyltransferase, partial [Myxococcota bacterium]